MWSYMNLHVAFEQMRIRARRDSEAPPPRVLLLGQESSGKTTACKILANYAVRAGVGWSPMLVNVDPGEVRSGRCLFVRALTTSEGWMDNPWYTLGVSSDHADPNIVPRKSSWIDRDVCSNLFNIFFSATCCILVWPRRSQTEWETLGKVSGQPRGLCSRQIGK